MANYYTHIDPRPILDYDDVIAAVSVPATNVDTSILSFRSKIAFLGEITRFAQSFDAAMDTFVTFSLFVDGVPVAKYINLTVQVSSPSSDADLPVPIKIGQGSLVEVFARSTVAGTFNARVRVLYYDTL